MESMKEKFSKEESDGLNAKCDEII
jgi:heat shock 70kDa protein 1/2/6/8